MNRVEVDKTVLPELVSERLCEEIGVIEVSKISSQERILQFSQIVELGVYFRWWKWSRMRGAEMTRLVERRACTTF